MYLVWRTLVGLNEDIVLLSMIAVHTKDVVEGAFVNIKRNRKAAGATTPRYMVRIIEMRSTSSLWASDRKYFWRQLNAYLEAFFRMPTSFSGGKYHVLKVGSDGPRVLFAKNVSTSVKGMELKEYKNNANVEVVRRAAAVIFADNAFEIVLQPLETVRSSQQNTGKGYLMHNIIDRYYSGGDKVTV